MRTLPGYSLPSTTEMNIHEVFTRIFIQLSEIDKRISFYENLCGKKCTLRFKYDEKNLELAVVGSFLLIAGSESHLEPFKETRITCLVDSVDDFKTFLQEQGASILDAPKATLTGRNMRARHIDGLVVEYVEHEVKGEA